MRRLIQWIRAHRPAPARQQGQVVLILVFVFIGLLAVVGLVTDGALIYVHYDHLRRSVDAASVSAVNQYRENRTAQDLFEAAAQTLQLQLPGMTNARLYWCSRDGPGTEQVVDLLGQVYDPHDPALCSTPPRKQVRVQAWLPVTLTFLSLVWDNQVTITASAQAEAAVLNMVLLIDTSESMGYNTCDPNLPETEFFNCLIACRNAGTCQPMEDVRSAAALFVGTLMRDGVDRVAIYHLDRTPVVTTSVEMFPCSIPPTLTLPITLSAGSGLVIPLSMNKNEVLGAINRGRTDPTDPLNVYIRPRAYDPATNQACVAPVYVGGYRGEEGDGYGFRWASTNIGGGLRQSIVELVNNGSTDAATWVIVLLSDGSANATDQAANENGWWTCPSPAALQAPPVSAPNERSRFLGPFCRDAEPGGVVTRHCPSMLTCSDPVRIWYTNHGETDLDRIMWFYDADDYARDMADLASSQGIAVYTIGFGPLVAGAGENLLRYIADVGDDGDLQTAPCGSDAYWDDVVVDPIPDPFTNCGNYYFAPDAAALEDVFESIASRIFSRITE